MMSIVKVILSVSLLVATSASSAFAGHWVGPTYSGPRTASAQSALTMGSDSNPPFSAQKSLNVTATYTWVHDDASNPSADPVPKVMVKEVAVASWNASDTVGAIDDVPPPANWSVSGNANNGLGSPERPSPDPQVDTGKGGIAKGVRTKIFENVETITCSVSMSANVSGTVGVDNVADGNVSLSYGVSMIGVHAHPKDLVEKSHTTSTSPLKITVTSKWSSTSGNVKDIPDVPQICWVYERVKVTNASGSGTYTPPNPPWANLTMPFVEDFWSAINGIGDTGTILGEPGIKGEFEDTFTIDSIVITRNTDGSITPHKITKVQHYLFHCEVCMTVDESEVLAGPFNLEFAIEKKPNTSDTYQIRISAHGYSVATDVPTP